MEFKMQVCSHTNTNNKWNFIIWPFELEYFESVFVLLFMAVH